MYLRFIPALFFLLAFAWGPELRGQDRHDPRGWEIHDPDRAQPPVVDPGTSGTEAISSGPPSDGIVLFDGADLSQWVSARSGDAPWTVGDGYFEVVPGSEGIRTRRSFGDVQLHIEWAAPEEIVGEGQGRGNSGVFLMDRYEVQILDSYDNVTYPDGQAAAIYGQYPPLVNAMRPPGAWNSFEIIFHRPRFDDEGGLRRPALVTVFHNGVLVQDHVALTGPTGHYSRPAYEPHADRLPISLQDHGNLVRFRNVWVRELE